MKPLALLIALAFSTLVANAQSLNIYHNIVKKIVRKNFKLIEEHRPEEMMSGLSDKNLEHTFAGDNSLSGTRHGQDVQFEAGIKEAKAPKIES